MRRIVTVPLAAWLAGLAAIAAAFRATGSGAVALTALLAPVLVAAVVPAAAGRPGTARAEGPRDAAAALTPAAALMVIAAPVGLAAALALGTFLGAFGCLAVGLRVLCGTGRTGEGIGPQVAATLLLLALLGGVFAVDPLVEKLAHHPAARDGIIRVAVGWNPMLVLGGRILGIDLMHADLMYSRLSVIARYYRFEYPGWTWVAGGYAGAGLAAWCVGRGLAGRRRHAKGATCAGS